jgi:DNA polymerase-3 subunit alpha
MQIAQVLASYTLGGADMLRRAMGKKKAEEMQKQRSIFQDGAAAKNIDADTASGIFTLMEKFADYGFNKSHSAAYALVSYQTAWLKCYYPAFFMAAVLSADMHNTDKIVIMVEECRRMGLKVLPPDINSGHFSFTVSKEGQIIYGLGAIKGLGEGPVTNIVKVREESGPFKHLFDFCKRVDLGAVNKRALEALIRSGAFDNFGADRAVLLASMSEAVRTAEQNSRSQASGVHDLFGEIVPAPESEDVYANFRMIRPLSDDQRLKEEKETLGLWLSGHPIAEHLPEIALITRNRIDNLKAEKSVQLIGGLIYDIRLIKSKRGGMIAILTLDDRSARIEATLYGELYQQHRELLRADAIVVVEGVVAADEYNGNGQLQIKVRQIKSLQSARCHYARSLSLSLHQQYLPVKSLATLAALLAGNRQRSVAATSRDLAVTTSGRSSAAQQARQGASNEDIPCNVIVKYQSAEVQGSLVLGRDWRIYPDEVMLQKLSDLYGAKNIVLNYS